EVLSPGEFRPDPAATHCRSAVRAILDRQHPTVEAAGEHVRLLAGQALLTSPEADIVGSLAHMQANRLLGIDRDRERRCHALWSLALRAIRGRPAARTALWSGNNRTTPANNHRTLGW
ncbi:MAG: lantibiotic dehydratase C-terminal domain-containing protein, partial [Haloechinothrix sp.]